MLWLILDGYYYLFSLFHLSDCNCNWWFRIPPQVQQLWELRDNPLMKHRFRSLLYRVIWWNVLFFLPSYSWFGKTKPSISGNGKDCNHSDDICLVYIESCWDGFQKYCIGIWSGHPSRTITVPYIHFSDNLGCLLFW